MKKSELFLRKFFFLTIAFFLAINFPASAAPSRELVVVAEHDMVPVMTKIAHEFSQKTGSAVSVDPNLLREIFTNIIADGAPLDVVVSCDSKLIDDLRHEGLVDAHSTDYIAGDSVALATNVANPNIPPLLRREKSQGKSLAEALKILDENNATLLVEYRDNPFYYHHNLSGKFSDDFLRNLSLPNLKIFRNVDDGSSTSPKVSEENSFYTLLLASEARNKKNMLVLATEKNTGILYQAVVINGDNMEIAREFVKFLHSNIAKEILVEFGFERLGKN